MSQPKKVNGVPSTRFCLICNTKTKCKRKSIQLNKETVSTLSAFWDLSPFDNHSGFSYEDLLTCTKCHRSLRQLSNFLKQLETLKQVLSQMKARIEQHIKKSEFSASQHKPTDQDDEVVDQRIQILRSAIIQNKSTNSRTNDLSQFGSGQGRKKKPESTIDTLDSPEVPENSSNNSQTSSEFTDRNPENLGTHHRDNNEDSPATDPDDLPSDKPDCLLDEDSKDLNASVSDRLKCSQNDCRFTFKDEIGRQAHIKKLHEGSKYPFHCELCCKGFRTRRQLNVHVMGHKGESPFICEQCGKGFRMERLLKEHLKIIHKEGTLKCKCNYCPKSFLNKTKLATHETTHTKCYPVSCSTCGKGFPNNSGLRIHIQTHTSSDNPWTCGECGKTFTTKKAMECHKSIHTGLFKVFCNLCSWGGPSKAALNKHMFKHSEQSVFECQTCSKKFKFPNTLTKHMKTHSNQKNYNCTVCYKSFIDSYKLNRHIQIHEGNRPHQCSKCQKRFYTKDALKSHAKIHDKQPSTSESSKSSPEPNSTCNPDLTLAPVEAGRSFLADLPIDVQLPESLEIPLSQIFDPCEFIPCNESPVDEVGSIKTPTPMTPILPDLGSPDIFPGEIFQFAYTGLPQSL